MTDNIIRNKEYPCYDASYAKYMDHTVLKPATVKSTVERFCSEAIEYGFASVCVNPTHVKFVAEKLEGTEVKTCCVVGFPLGANTTYIKENGSGGSCQKRCAGSGYGDKHRSAQG